MRLIAVLATLALAALLAACGSEDGLSKQEFAKEANSICRDLEKKVKAIGEGANSREEVGAALDKVIDETEKSVEKLKDLDPPDGDAGETASNYVDAFESDVEEKAVPAFERLRDAVKSNDQAAGAAALDEITKLESQNKSDKFAKELGAKACAS